MKALKKTIKQASHQSSLASIWGERSFVQGGLDINFETQACELGLVHKRWQALDRINLEQGAENHKINKIDMFSSSKKAKLRIR